MYGSVHVEPDSKGEPTVPAQDVAKIAKRHVQVIATREQNTTKLCAGCWRKATKCGKRHQSIGSGPPHASCHCTGAGGTVM